MQLITECCITKPEVSYNVQDTNTTAQIQTTRNWIFYNLLNYLQKGPRMIWQNTVGSLTFSVLNLLQKYLLLFLRIHVNSDVIFNGEAIQICSLNNQTGNKENVFLLSLPSTISYSRTLFTVFIYGNSECTCAYIFHKAYWMIQPTEHLKKPKPLRSQMETVR
jgi:hypothetical protein